jgi:hypothetical protein
VSGSITGHLDPGGYKYGTRVSKETIKFGYESYGARAEE